MTLSHWTPSCLTPAMSRIILLLSSLGKQCHSKSVWWWWWMQSSIPLAVCCCVTTRYLVCSLNYNTWHLSCPSMTVLNNRNLTRNVRKPESQSGIGFRKTEPNVKKSKPKVWLPWQFEEKNGKPKLNGHNFSDACLIMESFAWSSSKLVANLFRMISWKWLIVVQQLILLILPKVWVQSIRSWWLSPFSFSNFVDTISGLRSTQESCQFRSLSCTVGTLVVSSMVTTSWN